MSTELFATYDKTLASEDGPSDKNNGKQSLTSIIENHNLEIDEPVHVESARALVNALRTAITMLKSMEQVDEVLEWFEEMDEDEFKSIFKIDPPEDGDNWKFLMDKIKLVETRTPEANKTNKTNKKRKVNEENDASSDDEDDDGEE